MLPVFLGLNHNITLNIEIGYATSLASQKMALIEIAGAIAAGKTTLARALESETTKVIYEDHTINPFCTAFYTNPSAFAFETELSFLLQHYHFAKRAGSQTNLLVVLDHSLELDVAYATIGLQNPRRNIFMTIYRELREEIGAPQVLVFIKCNPSRELKRIHTRGREFEQNITIDFLSNLQSELEKRITEFGQTTRVVTIDSEEIDFRSRGTWLTELRGQLGITSANQSA